MTFVQMFLLASVFFGELVFKFFKYPVPALVKSVNDNKLQSFLSKGEFGDLKVLGWYLLV